MTYLILIMRHPMSPFITHCGFRLWFLELAKSWRLMENMINYLIHGDRRFFQTKDFVTG